jgi:hypothetical protein
MKGCLMSILSGQLNPRSAHLLAKAQAFKTLVANLPVMGDEAIIVSGHWA